MIKNVVVLQTVIDELKGHAISLYERLRKIIANEDKSFFVFSNEHHKETFIERENEETVNDRNDRAIRKAAFWYSRHLSQLEISKMKDSSYKVIFLSDDFDNRQKAKELGLFSISSRIR